MLLFYMCALPTLFRSLLGVAAALAASFAVKSAHLLGLACARWRANESKQLELEELTLCCFSLLTLFLGLQTALSHCDFARSLQSPSKLRVPRSPTAAAGSHFARSPARPKLRVPRPPGRLALDRVSAVEAPCISAQQHFGARLPTAVIDEEAVRQGQNWSWRWRPCR